MEEVRNQFVFKMFISYLHFGITWFNVRARSNLYRYTLLLFSSIFVFCYKSYCFSETISIFLWFFKNGESKQLKSHLWPKDSLETFGCILINHSIKLKTAPNAVLQFVADDVSNH